MSEKSLVRFCVSRCINNTGENYH